jgi:hypothetical protein
MAEFAEFLAEMYLEISHAFQEERGWVAWMVAVGCILFFIAAIWLSLEYVS